eukprot:jgi/Psemu1/310396/fgenesh1_kg.634_\
MTRNARLNPFRTKRCYNHGDVAPSLDIVVPTYSSIDQIKDGRINEQLKLSPLPAIVSKFIIESAEKAYKNMDSEDERSEFADSLEFVLSSVMDGKEIPQQRNPVIELLAKTTLATLDSIDDEEEQDLFLRGIFQKVELRQL